MKCLVILCLIGVAIGAEFQALPSTNPDFPGQCWLEDLKVAVKPGEKYSQVGECIQYICNDDFGYTGQTCGVQAISEPGCKLVSDNTLKYPDCCPKVVC